MEDNFGKLINHLKKHKDIYEKYKEIKEQKKITWRELFTLLLDYYLDNSKIEQQNIKKWKMEMQNLRKVKEEILFRKNLIDSLEKLYRETKDFNCLREYVNRGFLWRREKATQILEEFIQKKKQSIIISKNPIQKTQDKYAQFFLNFNRLFILGGIGKGKTEILKFLIRNTNKPAIIFDFIGNIRKGITIEGYDVCYELLREKMKDFFLRGETITIHLKDIESYKYITKLLWEEREIFKDYFLFIDETYLFIEQRRNNYKGIFLKELYKLSRMGRNWGVKIIATSQRLSNIDKDFLNVFSNFLVFELPIKREVNYFSDNFIYLDEYQKDLVMNLGVGRFMFINYRHKEIFRYIINEKIIKEGEAIKGEEFKGF